MTICSECDRTATKRGFCDRHYAAWRRTHGAKRCAEEGCDRPCVAQGLCDLHYRRQRKAGSQCSIDGCLSEELARGWCSTHYSRWQRTGAPGTDLLLRSKAGAIGPCSAEGCSTGAVARGFCPVHYRRWRLYGDPLGLADKRKPKTREQLRVDAVMQAPGGSLGANGYRVRSGGRGQSYAEHRLVMEYHIGRALYPDETVHHVNGNRSDNRIDNLELWSSWQPGGQRVADKLAWAREIIARYGD